MLRNCQRLYAYISVGDNKWAPGDLQPIDSRATVNALFDWVSETYKVERVYWRGEQDRIWLRHFESRRENPLYYDFGTDWMRYLTDSVKTENLAVAAARRHGMQIYIFDALFDHGAQGDAGGCMMFPYPTEDRLRLEHPEWCPVDRWGERVGPGPIDFSYPAARKALVTRYLYHVTKYGYDGICFYTYVENMGLRYLDEFGFNEPIVKEFKRRHGVDIRTEEFNKDAWYRLRGEYLTQFISELHTVLAAKGKKLSIVLRHDDPSYPQPWYAARVGMPGAGMVHMDWEKWVKEGIVDELFVWHGGPPLHLHRIHDVCKGSQVELTVFCSSPFDPKWKPLFNSGVTPCACTDWDCGMSRFALEPTSVDTLKSTDWRLRAQTLADISSGILRADAVIVASLVNDRHVLVRREVMRTLGALKASDHVSVLEAGLADRESSVRIAAANALAKVNGPETPSRIVSVLSKASNFPMKEACAGALAAMKEKAQPTLVAGMKSSLQPVREVCVRALGRNGLADSRGPLLSALRTDEDYRIRFHAISGLSGAYRVPEVIDSLLDALLDLEPTVQLWAAKTLGEMAEAMAVEQSRKTLDALTALFRQYGDGCERSDAAWGWRAIGNAITAFGRPGKTRLETMRKQRQDRWLAWAAYQVLHAPQSAEKVIVCEENDAIETHKKYAPPFPGHRR